MADLMAGESATGFIGFEAVSRGMGRAGEDEEEEEEGGVEEVSHGAGAEFQVVMKQLGKRDATTKLKVREYAWFVPQVTPTHTLCGVWRYRHCRSSLLCVRGSLWRLWWLCSTSGASCTTNSAQYVHMYIHVHTCSN